MFGSQTMSGVAVAVHPEVGPPVPLIGFVDHRLHRADEFFVFLVCEILDLSLNLNTRQHQVRHGQLHSAVTHCTNSMIPQTTTPITARVATVDATHTATKTLVKLSKFISLHLVILKPTPEATDFLLQRFDLL